MSCVEGWNALHLPSEGIVISLAPEAWMRDALCAQIGGDLFFPERYEQAKARKAKAICAKCPVATECLEFAIRTNQSEGIWGGLSEKQRKRT